LKASIDGSARNKVGEGRALIQAFEGFSPVPYVCPAGTLMVGYGHVILDGETFDRPLSPARATIFWPATCRATSWRCAA
jgi:GH24 family phage-related lysozyme (muramidase)